MGAGAVAGGGSGGNAAAVEGVGAAAGCGGGAGGWSVEGGRSAPVCRGVLRTRKREIPVSVAFSGSSILLLLVAGASTGAAAAAVVVCVGALSELGVGSGCVGCFFFLRRLNRLRRHLLTWAKASSAMSER